MKPVQLYSSRISKWKHLHNEIRLDVLGAMTACDQSGRDKVFALRKYSIKCFKYYKKFGEKPIVPVITGKHLIDIGLTPGPEFSVILKKYYNLQLEGMTWPDLMYKLILEYPENQHPIINLWTRYYLIDKLRRETDSIKRSWLFGELQEINCKIGL